jgi:hypothetical protein
LLNVPTAAAVLLTSNSGLQLLLSLLDVLLLHLLLSL